MNVLYLDRKTNKIYNLKPCPFCGGEAKIDNEPIMEMGCHWDSYFVICSKCEARSVGIDERFEEMDKIIEAWNRRANDDNNNINDNRYNNRLCSRYDNRICNRK